jgi:hypothetical protein
MSPASETEQLQVNFDLASRRLLEDRAVPTERGRMLQSSGLKAAGRFFAFTTKGELVVKLPEARVSELIASGVGQPCQLGRARPMREWVRLVPSDERVCAGYLLEARDFVARGP